MIYHLYLVALGICFLCSLISFRLHYPFYLKLFSIFLGISVITEIIVAILSSLHPNKNNYIIYSIFMLVEYILFGFFFIPLIQRTRVKQLIKIFLIIFSLFWVVTTFIIFGPRHWNSYIILFGDAFTISMCVVYFHQIFVAEELIDFRTSPEFWIVGGLFIYSSCELPITGMLNYLTINYEHAAIWLESALQVLNILMYIIFIYAYLCRLLTNTTK